MKQLTFIFCFLCCFASKSQTLAPIYTSGSYTIYDVEIDMDRRTDEAARNKTFPGSSKNRIGDTLIYMLQGNASGFTIKMTFNATGEKSNEKYCDFQQYIFDCPPCLQEHLKELIKTGGFRKRSENVYLSDFLNRTEMIVEDKEERLILTLKHVNLPTKEYEELYNKW